MLLLFIASASVVVGIIVDAHVVFQWILYVYYYFMNIIVFIVVLISNDYAFDVFFLYVLTSSSKVV